MREVERARSLAGHWGWALMHGWTFDDVVKWAPRSISVEHAVTMKQAGITPDELGWHYEDQGRGDLNWRLNRRIMTVDQVVLEALAQRTR